MRAVQVLIYDVSVKGPQLDKFLWQREGVHCRVHLGRAKRWFGLAWVRTRAWWDSVRGVAVY